MPMKFLGKVLFPSLAPWKRRRQTRIMVWVVLTAMIFGGVIVAIMFFVNSKR